MEDDRKIKLKRILEGVLQQFRVAVGVPAIGVAISSSEQRILANSGTADTARSWPLQETSRFGIACITKLLVAIVAVELSRQGRFCLDQSIDDCLDDLCVRENFRGKITLRHLLSHTGGYQGPLIFGVGHRMFNWNMFPEQLADSNQIFEPGKVFNYENTGHVIVGEAIQRATGREVSELIKEMIFEPLNIVPGGPLQDYKDQNYYVASHRVDNGLARILAPSPFGSFWKASLADVTLTLDDMLSIGEALLGLRNAVDFSLVRAAMDRRMVALPRSVSGTKREHSPAFFSMICAEYGSGWFGYAGSALGQTCGLRFDFKTKTVCAVGLNAWLPVVRDALLDRICNVQTHADAGLRGGNPGFAPASLVGNYIGGGNIIRSVDISMTNNNQLQCTFGPEGLQAPPLLVELDEENNLIPDPTSLMPGLGFFPEPETGTPCVLIGVAALKKVT